MTYLPYRKWCHELRGAIGSMELILNRIEKDDPGGAISDLSTERLRHYIAVLDEMHSEMNGLENLSTGDDLLKNLRSQHCPRVAVIDADEFYRQIWSMANPALTISTFPDPGAFLDFVRRNEAFRSTLDCVLMDYNFPASDGQRTNSEQAARIIREEVKVPVILNSRETPAQEDAFDVCLPRKSTIWIEVLKDL